MTKTGLLAWSYWTAVDAGDYSPSIGSDARIYAKGYNRLLSITSTGLFMWLYRNVPKKDAPFSMMVRSGVTIPLSMKGETITFYTAAIEEGKMPPVRNLEELSSDTPYVIMMDTKRVTVGQ